MAPALEIVAIPAFAGYEQVVRGLHASAKVKDRHLILPIDQYLTLGDFGDTNDLFIEHAVELGCAALSRTRACSPATSM